MYRPTLSEIAISASSSSSVPADDGDALRVETQTILPMHNAVKAEGLSIFVRNQCLLSETELKIAEHMRTVEVRTSTGDLKSCKAGLCYGLVGPNGCGKSTLLRLMVGGRLPIPPKWDVFLVSQKLPEATNKNPIEEVLSADVKRSELLIQQARLEEDMALAEEENDAGRFAETSQRLLDIQEDLARWVKEEENIAAILLGLGFGLASKKAKNNAPTLSTPINQLSCGWHMKVQLAKALWLSPKLLLLDEPTNHLDQHALLWLEQRLQEYPHTVVVVSHDVSFLHSTCWEIIWVNQRKIESMPRDAVTQEDLARMQRKRSLNFRFTIPEDSPENHGVSFHDVEFDYASSGSSSGSRCKKQQQSPPPLLRVPGNVRFSGNSRCAFLGRNGSGKSTFLGLCAGKLKPTKGTVDVTPDCKIGYFSQQEEMFDEKAEETAAMFLIRRCREALEAKAGIAARPLAAMAADRAEAERPSEARRRTAVTEERALLETARGVLSQFGLEGDVAIGVPAYHLSGGQKACLKLAVLSLQPSHILFMDEPTNHLDAEAREALIKGLANFKGGIVVVTHDDTLIYRLLQCNWSKSEIIVCEHGAVRCEKNFSGYRLQSLKEDVRKAEATEAAASSLERKRRQLALRPAKLRIDKIASSDADRPSFEPTTPPGFFRVSAEPQPQLESPVDAVPLAPTRTAKPASTKALAKKNAATCAPASKTLSRSVVREKPAPRADPGIQEKRAPKVVAVPRPSVWEARKAAPKIDLAEAFPSLTELQVTEPRKSLDWGSCKDSTTLSMAPDMRGLAVRESDTDVPENWEDLFDSESSDSGTVTASVQNHHKKEDAPKAGELMHDTAVDMSDTGSPAELQVPNVTMITIPETSQKKQTRSDNIQPFDKASRACVAPLRSSGHSRFRKDLVNLDKAATKWLKEERAG
jgi:ATPase subunit of ABC transporter with duplicated ATPase domains